MSFLVLVFPIFLALYANRFAEWLKKSVASDLEKFYRSTDALVEQLREGGGPGAFVSVQDIIDEIPKTQQN